METDISTDNAALDRAMIDDAEHQSLNDILASKTPDQRVVYLKRYFYKYKQPVQAIGLPTLCKDYPEFNDDILAAYLQHTNFTAKIIVNYDGACKQFFTDSRKQDCGKLVLTEKERHYLEQVKQPGLQINRVFLEVGTAFRTLCHIILRASAVTGEVSAMCKPQIGDHPLLMKFLHDVCTRLNREILADNQSGFTIDDLETIASWFLRPREDNTTYDMSYRNRWGQSDEWMSLGTGWGVSTWNRGYMAHLW